MATSEIRHLLVLLVAGLMASWAESANIEEYMTTQAERIEFIKAHNKYRSDFDTEFNQPSASNMNRMYWNLYLEATATDWARQCKGLVHGQTDMKNGSDFKNFTSTYGDAFGQNMFKGKPASRINATYMMTVFAKEANNFKFDSNSSGTCSGKTCLHYTQVVWATTIFVGCGIYHCDPNWMSFCNYVPFGNYAGAPAYKPGAPCSECATMKSGFKECENKLCVPSNRCSPVTECQVVDLENCLCSEEENNKLVSALLNHETIGKSKNNGNYQIASVTVILSLLAAAAVLFDVTL